MSMFWIGFGVGIFVGGVVGLMITALCNIAREDDDNGNN